ncbi:MAG: segregation/condensation protein A [Coleofasciculaceae cyanobacterium]
MTLTPASEAIALLIDLAQRGEINPWDVQVIEVIDRYLSTLALDRTLPTENHGNDLSQSGQAFLWASMLVLLKANTLDSLEEAEEEFTDLEEEPDALKEYRMPLHLERHLRRRRAAPPAKIRPVTLSELIEQLQQMATELDDTNYTKRSSRQRHSATRTQANQIVQLAHDENLTEIAKQLEIFLSCNWKKIAAEKDWLNLDQLLDWWTKSTAAFGGVDSLQDSYTDSKPCQAEVLRQRKAAQPELNIQASSNSLVDETEFSTHDRVGVFWALLLLSAQSKVELFQEEFYQDLKIRALEQFD